jgi:uncharacterized protein YbjT (DUF2867 family)
MTKQLTVLVAGATGNQGGAVANALLKRGHKVRALTRNKESSSAKRLVERGAEIMQVNLDDMNSVTRAMQEVDTFYLMGSPFEGGVEAETKQGIRLADAAKEANIGHLVYGSVASADQNTLIPHFDSKYAVEQHIKNIAIPYTISAPVYFMDNAIAPWSIDGLKQGKIAGAMPADKLLQQISVQNIGEFVASIINRRETVFGQRFDIAGDELTGNEAAAILSEKMKHTIQFVSFPASVLKEQDADMGAMFEWFDKTGYDVNIADLHKSFPDVDWQDYAVWVESQNWSFLDN